jgi:alkylation response protein AidB-like acyl-CoA dehydrogenase
MDFARDDAVEAFRHRTRELLAEQVTPEVLDRVHGTGTQHDWGLHRAIAATGLIADGIGSASRSGRDPLELFTFFDELGLANAPFHGLANTMLVAGVIEEVGTDFHRCEILPRLHSGEAIVAFGYSEPDHGSDVASASTRARPAEDGSGDWVIDGQKMFTSFAHEAAYVLLLTRTNPDVAKHRGLTMFLVPLDRPGIEIQPVMTLGGDRTNITFYSGVRVSDEWRLGDVDGGWQIMTVALAYERGVLGNTNQAVRLLERCRSWAATTARADGTRPLDDPTVRARLARIAIDNEIARLLSLRAASIASSGGVPAIEGTLAKLFASEAYARAAEACQCIVGPDALLDPDEPEAPADGWIDRAVRDAPVTSIYGGTSEIQRGIIAERHLGLPRDR